jgi:predicted RNase H-like nuclease (RuvC/YqgF family)
LEVKDNEILSLKQALAEAKEENKEAGKTHEQNLIKIKNRDETIGELRENLEKAKEDICHTRFCKANRMQTMYVLGSTIHVHINLHNRASSHKLK